MRARQAATSGRQRRTVMVTRGTETLENKVFRGSGTLVRLGLSSNTAPLPSSAPKNPVDNVDNVASSDKAPTVAAFVDRKGPEHHINSRVGAGCITDGPTLSDGGTSDWLLEATSSQALKLHHPRRCPRLL